MLTEVHDPRMNMFSNKHLEGKCNWMPKSSLLVIEINNLKPKRVFGKQLSLPDDLVLWHTRPLKKCRNKTDAFVTLCLYFHSSIAGHCWLWSSCLWAVDGRSCLRLSPGQIYSGRGVRAVGCSHRAWYRRTPCWAVWATGTLIRTRSCRWAHL